MSEASCRGGCTDGVRNCGGVRSSDFMLLVYVSALHIDIENVSPQLVASLLAHSHLPGQMGVLVVAEGVGVVAGVVQVDDVVRVTEDLQPVIVLIAIKGFVKGLGPILEKTLVVVGGFQVSGVGEAKECKGCEDKLHIALWVTGEGDRRDENLLETRVR